MQATQSLFNSLKPRVAILYQAVEPPVINGVRKPAKPGGYRDSSADIAYVLRTSGVDVATPTPNPNPRNDRDWCFADTEQGILDAVQKHNATHLWANTILFSSHPLQQSTALSQVISRQRESETGQGGNLHLHLRLRLVGQPPNLVEQFDDKNFVNDLLRRDGSFDLPRSWLVHSLDDLDEVISPSSEKGAGVGVTTSDKDKDEDMITFPIIAKPIRGRGSHGVTLCRDRATLEKALKGLLSESSPVMLEEYLDGEEATVTVMPPSYSSTPPSLLSSSSPAKQPSSSSSGGYRALPLVVRLNHQDGIAPYNGTVAVISNSRALDPSEQDRNPAYGEIARACERVAAKLAVTAPIRIDVRQRRRRRTEPGEEEKKEPEEEGGKERGKENGKEMEEGRFAIFDVNMKPNMTGPGRPGREDQASLTAMAAAKVGWDYPRLLREILGTALPLDVVRERKIVDV